MNCFNYNRRSTEQTAIDFPNESNGDVPANPFGDTFADHVFDEDSEGLINSGSTIVSGAWRPENGSTIITIYDPIFTTAG